MLFSLLMINKSSIEINIFTNCGYYSPSLKIIKKTYDSFLTTFPNDEYKIRVFVDKNPYNNRLNKYLENLRKLFKDITITSSLSDGYIKAIQSSEADILFMIEHDWIFNTDLIAFSLLDIASNAPVDWVHIRFNQFVNISKEAANPITDEIIQSVNNNENFCKTNKMSNNPHLIHKDRYIRYALKYVKHEKGNKGIEENLDNQGLKAYTFGKLGYPPTIRHTNGRYPEWKVPLWRIKLKLIKFSQVIKKGIKI
jgi:hypothetical protein